jgi:hypothetical protein
MSEIDELIGEEETEETVAAAQRPGVKELNRFEKIEWRTILVPEDALVVALQKSLMRNGEEVSLATAYQAVRDVVGEIHAQMELAAKTNIADLTDVLKGSDGSDDGKDRPTPMPNP